MSLGHKGDGGCRQGSLACENRNEVSGMFFDTSIGPQCMPHARKLLAIRWVSNPRMRISVPIKIPSKDHATVFISGRSMQQLLTNAVASSNYPVFKGPATL